MKQSVALDILKTGAHVFLTGAPGSGKTHTLNQYITYLKEHAIGVAVTASTGIAATHIGGVTIHSWSGVGIRKNLTPQELDSMEDKKYLWKRYEKTRVLVIDEISMLDGQILDTVNAVCKQFKRNDKPFGGMQVVLVGDFFQLPPVSRPGEGAIFAFDSESWKELKPLVCYLGEQHRQDDEKLLQILDQIRSGDVEEGFEILQDRQNIEFEDIIKVTKLYTHNQDVDAINVAELAKLGEGQKTFTMMTYGAKNHIEKLVGSCLSPQYLDLKVGAVVMCTKNNFDAGYANGTLGEVVGFDDETGNPIIVTNEQKEITIAPVEWAIEDTDRRLASIEQIPLRLAWAITVHKSQGMSLDAAEIDLSKAFEYGQGYVALSRVRTLSGLKLLGFHPNALMIHPLVLKRDKRFRSQSDQIKAYVEEKTDKELAKSHQEFIVLAKGSLEKIDWKKTQETEETISTFEKTRRLLGDGMSINDVAKERGITQKTVLSHLEKLMEDKKITREDILFLQPRTKKFKDILETFQRMYNESNETHLAPIKNKLGSSASYFDIQLARLFLER
jgi:ATP-dependent DNA helicase PIF1